MKCILWLRDFYFMGRYVAVLVYILLHVVIKVVIVYPKDRPVSPRTARVTISYPAFFIMYGIGGWGA